MKYLAVFGITLRQRLAYLTEQLARGAFLAVVIFVFVYLWRTTFGVSGSVRLGGFSLAQMIWYLVFTEAIATAMPRTRMAIDREVRSGDLAYRLNKPYSYLLFHYGATMAECLLNFAANVAIGGAVAWWMVGGFPYRWEAAAAQAVTVWSAFSLAFFLAAAVGLCAFWMEDTAGLGLMVERTMWILGGMLIPIDLFPPALQTIARTLPFADIIGAPARLIVDWNPAFWAETVARQGVWLAALAGLATWIYRAGVRRVHVNGG